MLREPKPLRLPAPPAGRLGDRTGARAWQKGVFCI
jgi:hypothetical protein